jgi:RNA-directed DNA polymerase
MSEPDADQKAEMPERPPRVGNGIAESTDAARQADGARDEHAEDRIPVTLETALCRENMWRAYERVVGNQGAPGIDGITVEDLKPLLQTCWEAIRKELLDGTYQPSPVRKVEIPKPDGDMRTLGIRSRTYAGVGGRGRQRPLRPDAAVRPAKLEVRKD